MRPCNIIGMSLYVHVMHTPYVRCPEGLLKVQVVQGNQPEEIYKPTEHGGKKKDGTEDKRTNPSHGFGGTSLYLTCSMSKSWRLASSARLNKVTQYRLILALHAMTWHARLRHSPMSRLNCLNARHPWRSHVVSSAFDLISKDCLSMYVLKMSINFPAIPTRPRAHTMRAYRNWIWCHECRWQAGCSRARQEGRKYLLLNCSSRHLLLMPCILVQDIYSSD